MTEVSSLETCPEASGLDEPMENGEGIPQQIDIKNFEIPKMVVVENKGKSQFPFPFGSPNFQSPISAVDVDSKIDLVSMSVCSTNAVSESPNFDLKCDDCSVTKPLRTWRWCCNCERVLCENCAVERHVPEPNGGNVEEYMTAYRRMTEEFQVVQKKAVETIKLLEKRDGKIQKDAEDVVKKFEESKRKIGAMATEGDGTIDKVRNFLESTASLRQRALNAKQMQDRRKLENEMQKLAVDSKSNDAAVKKKLNDANSAILKIDAEFETIFRDGDL